MNRKRATIYALLAIIIIVSAYMTYLVYTGKTTEFCLTDDESCDNVLYSEYSEIFGIKLSVISILWFSLMSLLFFSGKEKIVYNGFVISSVFAVYFILLQIFVLKALCLLCIIVDVSVILVFVLLFSDRKIYK